MNLDKVFNPRAIAVVGASKEKNKVGNDLVKNLKKDFKGKIYPVNPTAKNILGLKCYSSVLDIPGAVDLAVVAVPATVVPKIAQEVVQKKVGGMIVISAGFKETGNVDLENQLKKICENGDVALIGPNCLGVINSRNRMNASFSGIMPASGSVAFVSQSGALCTAVLDYARKIGIGFSKFVSVGNKAVATEADLINYLAKDPATKIIAMYVEQLSETQDFIKAVEKLNCGANPKPVIVLKSGRTGAGASASASHTGALAGNDAAYEALFNQCGVIRAAHTQELFEYIRVFANNKIPTGRRVAVITNAGGPGVLTTDEIILNDLELAKISPATTAQLKKVLPAFANVHNPVDMLGDANADRYRAVLKILAKSRDVDSIIVILTPQSMTQVSKTARVIIDIKRKTDKPIVVSFIGGPAVRGAVQDMQASHITMMNFPEQSAKALSALQNFGTRKNESCGHKFHFTDVNKKRVAEIFSSARAEGRNKFPEAEAEEVLRAYNFPVLKNWVVKSAGEASEVAHKIGQKLVMKIISPDILHKTDIGGVMLGISPDEAGEKYDEMMERMAKKAPAAKIEGVLIEEQVRVQDGVEMILGSAKDAVLGQTIMVGLGGVYVEVFKDVAFGLPPLTEKNVLKMIDGLHSKKILEGARGQGELDKKALVECVGRLSQLLTDFPEIKELDVNPLLVLPAGHGARVLDARIVLE